MKKFLTIILFANLQFGCSHIEVTPSGFKSTNLNIKNVTWTPNSFHADDINASTPLNSTWRGINRETDSLVSLGALFAPGAGTTATVVKGAGVVLPHVKSTPSETILTK